MKHLTQFVDHLTEAKGLSLSTAVRKDCVNALRIAGFEDQKKLDLQKRLAGKVVEKTWSKIEPFPILATTGGRMTTAAVVSSDSNCPRCGESMNNVKLANGQSARYCSNPRCRVTCYVG